ncbi:MAG: cytochrome C oxidase subunit II [Chloroflexi bacterium]|nr:cytochrome C oxidase subunit II [Chloroflexota bacterium]
MPIAPPPQRNWWDLPIGIHEKVWLSLVVLVGLSLFIMMPVWHVVGRQNSPTTTYRVSPDSYYEKVNAWTQTAARVEGGIKPPGRDVYLAALRFAWVPNSIVLEASVPYRIHLSSKDVNHGFSIHRDGEPAQKANFQVVPGYEYVLPMEFDDPGVYYIVCQEYCGIGHQAMLGKIVVEGATR